MTDRTLEPINSSIDRTLEISAENTRNISKLGESIAEMQTYVSQVVRGLERFAVAAEDRNQQHEARMAKIDARIELLEDAQRDTKEMLRMMIERRSGES